MQTVAETGGMPVERYDEKFERVDERFDDVDREFKRVGERFDEVTRRIGEGRQEAKERFDRVEGDIRQLREIGIPELKSEFKGEIRQLREIGLQELKGEIREVKEIGIPELKGELKGEIREVKEEIREVRAGLAAIQDSFNRLVLGAATSWVILMVTILAKG